MQSVTTTTGTRHHLQAQGIIDDSRVFVSSVTASVTGGGDTYVTAQIG